MALEDDERVRAIFELAVEQEMLDMPELLWKSYIDFEEESGEFDKTRQLFERLLHKTDHVKVWISYAHFEINADEGAEEEDEAVSEEAKDRARAVFERAYKSLKAKDLKEEVCYSSPVLLPIPEGGDYLVGAGANIDTQHRESSFSTPGNPSRVPTAPRQTSKRSKCRCLARSKRGESWTTTATRSIWTTFSRRTNRRMRGCSSYWKLRTSGSKRRGRRKICLRLGLFFAERVVNCITYCIKRLTLKGRVKVG